MYAEQWTGLRKPYNSECQMCAAGSSRLPSDTYQATYLGVKSVRRLHSMHALLWIPLH